jgi:hypothetical protein
MARWLKKSFSCVCGGRALWGLGEKRAYNDPVPERSRVLVLRKHSQNHVFLSLLPRLFERTAPKGTRYVSTTSKGIWQLSTCKKIKILHPTDRFRAPQNKNKSSLTNSPLKMHEGDFRLLGYDKGRRKENNIEETNVKATKQQIVASITLFRHFASFRAVLPFRVEVNLRRYDRYSPTPKKPRACQRGRG